MTKYLFETLDVCGKTFTVLSGYSVIYMPLTLAFIFLSIAYSREKFWPVVPAVALTAIAIFFLLYKEHLADKVTRTLIKDSQCIDAAFIAKSRMWPHASMYIYLDPKDIPNDSILQYQGNNHRVLEELAKRYEFGINGLEMNVDKANEIKTKLKTEKPQ